ncbi:MAG: protease inhibitor I9 family protein [Planctomycetota bacterium]|nr:protease inhibitor I9 family protein [Planctomycetota bacterium]
MMTTSTFGVMVLLLGGLGQDVAAPGIAVPGAKKRAISLQVTVPTSGWDLSIQEVYQVQKELWVISRLSNKGGIALQVISQVKDSVSIPASSLPVKYFVLGTRSNIKSKVPYQFLKDRKMLDKDLKQKKAKLVYRRPVKKQAVNPQGRYIVVYKKTVFLDGKTKKGETLEQLAKRHTRQFGGKMGAVLRIINGYSASFSPAAVEKLKKQPEVKYIEKDGPVGIN